VYFKYYHSEVFLKCILNTIGHVFVFYIFAKMKYFFFKILFKLSYVPDYGRNVIRLIFTVLIYKCNTRVTRYNEIGQCD